MRHELTDYLRTSELPYFVGLRRCLRASEIDPDTAALAESFDDDEHLVHGVVVSAEGGIYEFDYVFADEDAMAEGGFATWSEVPRTWSRLANESEIISALRFLGLGVDL